MKRNLLFNQATALGKRLAMVLTMLLIVGIGQAWGETATVTFSDLYNANTSVDGKAISVVDGITLTFNKRTGGTATQYYTSGSAMRWYGGGTLDVTSNIGNITAITMTYTQTANSVTSNVGTYSLSNLIGSWTGDATAIKFTQSGTSGHCRISKIAVTYTASSGGGDSGDDNTGGGGDCDVWKLVTDASELKVGDEIVIAAANADVAMSKNANTNKNENRAAEEITKSGNTIIINSFVQTITLENGTKNETFAFNTGSSYLYAASSSSNHLKTKNTLDDNGSWSISITSEGIATIKAQGSNTRNWLRYNGQSSLFSCYASGQADVSIYKYVECTAEPTVFVIPKCGGDGGGTWLVVIEWFATF
jgi:hypothetical protein